MLQSNDRVQIRQEGGLHFVRTGTDRGEEVRMVMRSATPEELRRVTWCPPVTVLDGLVSDQAAVGTRIVKEHEGGTLPLRGMYRVADAGGRESLFGNFAFAIGPARKEPCPAQRASTPSPWVGCYATRQTTMKQHNGPQEIFQVRQDGERLYVETGMEGTHPNSLVFKPATSADLSAFAGMVRGSAKGAPIEVTSGLAVYGVAIGTNCRRTTRANRAWASIACARRARKRSTFSCPSSWTRSRRCLAPRKYDRERTDPSPQVKRKQRT